MQRNWTMKKINKRELLNSPIIHVKCCIFKLFRLGTGSYMMLQCSSSTWNSLSKFCENKLKDRFGPVSVFPEKHGLNQITIKWVHTQLAMRFAVIQCQCKYQLNETPQWLVFGQLWGSIQTNSLKEGKRISIFKKVNSLLFLSKCIRKRS